MLRKWRNILFNLKHYSFKENEYKKKREVYGALIKKAVSIADEVNLISFKESPQKETIDGITFIRRGSMYTVHLYAFVYYNWELKKNIDIVVDNFHFIPFFTPLYISQKKIVSIIHEVAKNVWFYNCHCTYQHTLKSRYEIQTQTTGQKYIFHDS